jgi:endonuclease G
MKKLFFLLLLFPLLLFGQLRKEVYVDAGIYQVKYSEVLEQPLEIKYKVQCPDGTASRKGMDFYTNDSIRTSDNADYASNVWDKGHMAPAADFNCTSAMLKQTFSYLNCALQHQDLNRVHWRLLEEYERELAKKGTVTVTITVHFDKSQKLPSGATVPSGFTKKIFLNGKPYQCYYFPNEKPQKKTYSDYLISVCK